MQSSQSQQVQLDRQRPGYPWEARRLTLSPSIPIARYGIVQAPPSISPFHFPRYGHTLPATANATGELFLFGGLVGDDLTADLYSLSTRDFSAALWQTASDIPSPRLGHASALVGSVLIVWGGEKQENRFYLLNLDTKRFSAVIVGHELTAESVFREWTAVKSSSPAPASRYGYATTLAGSKFYIFGGRSDDEFFDDMWAFDLNTSCNVPEWELVDKPNILPAVHVLRTEGVSLARDAIPELEPLIHRSTSQRGVDQVRPVSRD